MVGFLGRCLAGFMLAPAVLSACGAAATNPAPPRPVPDAPLPVRSLAEAQALVDAAALGATVTLPRGVYDVPARGGLTLRKPVVLDGAGSILRGVGFDDAQESSRDRSALLDIETDGAQVRHLTVERAPYVGVVVSGSRNLVEEVMCRDAWMSCVGIRGGRENTLRYVEAHNSRHGTGIVIAPGADGAVRNLVIRSISHDNGRLPDGRQVSPIPGDPAGGGNSDGMGASKACSDDFPSNVCVANRWIENIMYRNADDGLDVTVADAEIRANIFWKNGPAGNRGVKMLRNGTALVAGNVSVHHDVGLELRFAEPGRILHNLALGAARWGIYSTGRASSEVLGNAVYQSPGAINCASGCTRGSNLEGTLQDAGLVDPGFEPALWASVYPASTVQERWSLLYEAFRKAYTPRSGSPLIDAGQVIPGYHCPSPGRGDGACVEWSGSAPDIGPFESSAAAGAGQPPTHP